MRFNSCIYRFAWPLVIGLFLHSSARAQFTSNVQGFVLDPSGAVVAGATVSLRNADTGVQNATKTGDGGNYRFSSLPPGNYVMSVEASGFKKTEVSFALSTGETQGIDVHLPVATAAAAVSVSAEAMTLNVDESRIQATLSAETVTDLPQLNRNIYDVLAVTPGVVGTGTRGRSYTGNRVLVDGMDVTSPIQNGNIVFGPVPDSVQEVSLQTNSWDAENNLGSSILILVTTKSGTNQFHGTGNLFYVNQNLQAKKIQLGLRISF